MVRFLYEVFFELVFCFMMDSTLHNDSKSFLAWFAAIAILLLSVAALVFLTTLPFNRYGPQKDDFYERHSCMSFLWKIRNIK